MKANTIIIILLCCTVIVNIVTITINIKRINKKKHPAIEITQSVLPCKGNERYGINTDVWITDALYGLPYSGEVFCYENQVDSVKKDEYNKAVIFIDRIYKFNKKLKEK